MKTFRIIAAIGLLLWIASGIAFGFREILPYLFWMGGLYVIVEVGTYVSIKKRMK